MPVSFTGALLQDGLIQVSMLLASLVIFLILGAFYFALLRRREAIGKDEKLWTFLVPAHRYRNGQLRVDLWMLAASRLLWFPLINAVGVILITGDFRAFLIDTFGTRETLIQSSGLMLVLQFLVTYLAIELGGYWAHRTLHIAGFLWSTHRAHHSAEVLTFLVGGRGHPLEHIVFLVFGAAIGGLANGGFLYLTGSAIHPLLPTCLIFLGLFGAVMDKISHSELPISFGVLDYVFMSGRMHQIHHSAEIHHRDKNFGGTMSLFDWIFGTAYRPAKDETFRLGLSPDELGENNPHLTLKALYLEPFVFVRDWWRGVRGRAQASESPAFDEVKSRAPSET